MPVSEADPQAIADAVWRAEGAQVLLWALGAQALPPHDVHDNPYAVAKALGVLRKEDPEILTTHSLRSGEDLTARQRQILGLHWRFREHDMHPGPVDMESFAAKYWGGFTLEGVRLIDGDLAVGDMAISAADPNDVANARSIALERHQAAN